MSRTIAPGKKGRQRLSILRFHRLAVFEEAFSDYVEGKCSYERLRLRGKKMLEIGLPKLR